MEQKQKNIEHYVTRTLNEEKPDIVIILILHLAESCIFKNLKLRRDGDRSCRGYLLDNYFRHLKLYSHLQADLLEAIVISTPTFLIEPIFQILARGTSSSKKI